MEPGADRIPPPVEARGPFWAARRMAASLVRLSLKKQRRGLHITRYTYMHRLPGVVRPIAPTGPVLAVSQSADFARHIGLTGPITEANYPEASFLDLPFPDNSFAAVTSDQVLEHVAGSPQRCFDETQRVLRPGGIAVHTTVFVYPIHGSPSDYWRFTPSALRLLAETAGLEVIEAQGWGNFGAWWAIRSGLLFEGVPETSWHPYRRLAVANDPHWPIVVWIVAQKPD